MEERISGFKGEFLWEFDIARMQLLALAGAVPEELYGWSPVEDARRFSAVLIHIAAGNLLLLRMMGAPLHSGDDLYGSLAEDETERLSAMVRKNLWLEQNQTGKQAVIELLRRSFEAVDERFRTSSAEELERPGEFFGERTTVRRVYLRALAHSHEHMGQAIAYVRAMGMRVPWPDPVKEVFSASLAVQEN